MTSKDTELRQFTSMPLWYKVRGTIMMIAGGGIATLCVFAPKVYMLGEHFSWLPLISIVVLIVGILRCVDALTTETPEGFLVNIQGAVLDIVVGFLVLFGINGIPEDLHLLIVGYMVTQGIYRNIILSVAKVPNPMSNRITGFISIILGLLIWFDWPTSAVWFLAFSLSIDICFRGWALIALASALKKQSVSSENT